MRRITGLRKNNYSPNATVATSIVALPTDQSKNTKILPPRPAKIGTETIDQAISAMLRSIVDDLAFTL